ncbi:penicillin-binding transpeptidase domain-containing protein [Demequina sp. SYSU T00068]|uniref:penicillin-binding transpeptidase domain-containing protein n=1 Tax=Demequina lignilytica TaxID=3051663 RepID=UPI002635CFEB|nr:penicillin-binding transpeptidase domain-containing protein [Demequina sp. SYSU T00068]MDN4489690.1 penicillin-binding transpeptidase domain-containing protein [Demequina sp. SYSU T00068]
MQHRVMTAVGAWPIVPGALAVLIVPDLDGSGRALLAGAFVVATALSLTVLARAAHGPVTALWSLAVLGAAVQLRLGAVEVGAAARLVLAAGLFFALVALTAAYVRPRIDASMSTWIPLVAASVALLARVAPLWRGDVRSGRLDLGMLSVQVGEFTRIMIVGVAIVLWSLLMTGALRYRSSADRLRVYIAGLICGLYIVLSLVADIGPTLVTVVAVVGGVLASGVPARRRKWPIVAVLAGVVLTVAVAWTYVAPVRTAAALALSRFDEVEDPGFQLAIAKAAADEGGLVGGGWGSSALAASIPAARSDYAVAVINADLGVATAVVAMITLLVSLRVLIMRNVARHMLDFVSTGLLVGAAVQAAWMALGAWGVFPLTGMSVPFLAFTGSALMSTVITVAIAAASVGDRASSHDALPSNEPVRVVTALVAVVLVGALVSYVSVAPRAAFSDFRARGDIVTRDGEVLATTNYTADGSRGQRIYPWGAQAAAVTGASFGTRGTAGLERAERATLTCGADSQWWYWMTDAVTPHRCEPADVVTTIDSRWQQAAADSLAGQHGSAIVLDSVTGEILALVDTSLADPATWDPENLPESEVSYEAVAPGSVFKPLVAAVALQAGVVTRGDVASEYVVNGERVSNIDGSRCADTSVQGALEQSCNTVFAQLAVEMGADALSLSLSEVFGVDRALSYDAGVATGVTSGISDSVTAGGLARTGFGQESVRATPLSIASSLSVISAAAGERDAPKAHLVAGKCTASGLQESAVEVLGSGDLEADVAREVLDGMTRAVAGEYGTMQALRALGFPVAGKSGTAQVSAEVSSSRVVYWAATVVGDKVTVVQIRDVAYGGANPATVAIADLLGGMPAEVSDLACGKGL